MRRLRFILGMPFAAVLLLSTVRCGDSPTGARGTPGDTLNGDPPAVTDEWLLANAHPLSSLTSTDFGDLGFLKAAIGDRRIVQLGESGHGVAEFNEAKSRLIQFFHEDMGFDVIAFESDLYSCYEADRAAGKLTPEQFMYHCIYGVWHTHEVIPLFQYIQETKGSEHPLILAGFDMKPSSSLAQATRPAFMGSVVRRLDPEYAEEVTTLEEELLALFHGGDWRTTVAARAGDLRARYRALHTFLVDHEAALLAAYPGDPATPLVAQQTAQYATRMVDYAVASAEGGCGGTEARDISMAENATFLANRIFPDEKILIWAHNFHIRHHNQAVVGTGCATMGGWLKDRHRPELYTIGLYMDRGTAAWNDRQVYTIYPAADNSLEEHLRRAGEPILFLDLLHRGPEDSPAWLFSHLTARSWGTYELTLLPQEQYDGVLYIEEVRAPAYTY